MSLWDDLPAEARNSGALDPLQGPLQAIDTTGLTPREVTDSDGTWTVRSISVDLPDLLGLRVDPRSGRVLTAGTAPAANSTPIEFVGTQATISYGRHLTGPGGTEDGGWHVDLDVPGIRIVVPALRGARLDAQGQLRFDPAHPIVKFTLPRLVIRTMQLAGGTTNARLKSASISGNPVDDIYSFIQMTPAHALIGPDDTVGFAFRTAVLDLSSVAGPAGVPAAARVLPDAWQGLHLPEVRLFVAPGGLEGIAVSAGVRDLWIGIGEHAGLTGSFGVEIVNRGGEPTVIARFITPGGRHIAAVAGGIVEVPDQSVFLVDARGGIAPLTTVISIDGAAQPPGDRLTLTVPASGHVTLSVVVTDGADHAGNPTEFSAQRPGTAAGTPPALDGPEPQLRQLTPETGHMVITGHTDTTATLRLDPPRIADWTWSGGSSTGETATVPVSAAAPVEVSATPAGVVSGEVSLTSYFSFDHPRPSEMTGAWQRNARNTTAGPDGTGQPFRDVAAARQAAIGSTPLTVDGYASFEQDEDLDINQDLSERRITTLVAILTDLGYTATPGTAYGHEPARDGDEIIPGAGIPGPGDGRWRMARAHGSVAAPPTVRAELSRNPIPQIVERDPQPAPGTGRPDCFRRLGAEVELIRDTFVRCEIWGEFDIQTAIESSLDEGGQPPLGTPTPNPGDGICGFRVRLRIATDRASWEVYGEFRALDSDLDGLLERRHTQTGVDPATLNVLGALAVMGPLSAQAAELSPAAGTLVQLGSMALGASNLVRTKVLTLRGADLTVSDGIIAPDGSTATDTGTRVSVMFDVEVQFTFDLTVIRVPEDRPISTRYQAVGVRSEWDTGTETEYLPVAVFDPNRGYELDIQPGSLVAQPPLDEILRIFGVRVSRDNPTYLEVEAGIGVDIGPVTIDTVRVRADLAGNEPPQLTRLGASLDIPGTVHGSGSVSITAAGFAAAFDLTIVPLDIRATASLAIETKDGVTGVLIGVGVEFPIPILLGNSGLGIFGLLGGVGINYARTENPTARVPALDWVMDQLGRPGGVMDPTGWEHRAGSYAFAAGLLLGTVEGGYILHLKGIILLELPGPRLLLVMKADVLKAPPVMASTQSATFLAVLDIDFGRGTFTLGVVADYTIEQILQIHVPVTAYFETERPERWLVDLGRYDDRVRVTVLGALEASGYLMVHGDGPSIVIPGLPQVSSGVAIATGFHLQAVLMGHKPARLYVEVAAGFDALLGFDPFFLAGRIYIRGELMLFIVSIGVQAELTLIVGKRIEGGVERDHPYVHGQVCGSVSFFFFDLSACVELTIGTEPDPQPDPRPLVAGVTLVGRSPALIEGSGTEHTDGAALGEALEVGAPVVGNPPPAEPVVPIDAIPAVLFHQPPIADGLLVAGSAPAGSSGVSGTAAWRRTGDRWWAYQVTAVELSGAIGPGPQPSNWWHQSRPGTSGEGPALALLSWLPTPFSSTISYGETLREQVEHRWGSVCTPAAPPQRQLWTFLAERLGPRVDGWVLDAVVWPDPDETLRTSAAARQLRVSEPWRTGSRQLDLLQGTVPAEVVGDLVGCPGEGQTPADDPFKVWAQDNGPSGPTTFAGDSAVDLVEATQLLGTSGALNDLAALWQESAADPELRRKPGCEGRILRAPTNTSTDPAPLGTAEDKALVQQAWDELGHRPDELADAVRLTPGEPVVSLTALLLMPMENPRQLWASVRTEKGAEILRQPIDHSSWVGPGNPLPASWVDPAGPFAAPIEQAGRLAARIAEARNPLTLALLRLEDLPAEATTVVIGWDRYLDEQTRSFGDPFYLIAVDALLASEVWRYDFDTTITIKDREALEQGLTQDPTDHALLTPDSAYQLSIRWRWDSAVGDAAPTRVPTFDDAAREQTQSFGFRTIPPAGHPRELTPWLLDTNPSMGDGGVFCTEPIRVALAHQNVTRLFAAYGRRLEVTVLSASGHHPRPPGGGAPGESLLLPLDLVPGLVDRRDQGIVLTPWDEMIGEIIGDQPCIEVTNVTRTIEEWTLSYDLEPLTDYLLDIHSVPESGSGERVRVHRCSFTTSRFDDLAHLASWIAPSRVEHRLVRDRSALDALPNFPTGAEWDDAVQRAGLPVPQTPAAPRTEVWWTQTGSGPAEPVAVVVECSEPLVRDRLMPTQITGPADGTDPSRHWWVARRRPWLQLAPATSPPDPGAAATLARPPVVGPGGTRVMCQLAPGSRERRLVLELVRAADELAAEAEARVVAVDVTMNSAPWEVED